MSGDRLPSFETRMLKARRSRVGQQTLIVWHRRLGIATAALVLLLAVTGLLLNHANRLGFDQTHVSYGWLLSWYGVEPARAPVTFIANGHWITGTGARLYFDAEPLAMVDSGIVGATAIAGGLIAVAFTDSLFILSPEGEIVERLATQSLPGRLQGVGQLGGERLVVATDDAVFVADQDLLEWLPAAQDPSWARPAEAPPELREQLMLAERGAGVTIERVLLDLHSGRLFGSWGPWLFDIAAIIFIVMAITGIIHWWRRRKSLDAAARAIDGSRRTR